MTRPALVAHTHDFSAWASHARHILEADLSRRFELMREQVPSGLIDAMCYASLDGGKRLRALLVLATAHFCTDDAFCAIDAACALEAMHAYSLVHDDLPCMDNDDIRRGKPACHIRFGQAMALLVGDSLQSAAFEWLVMSPLHESVRCRQLALLSKAVGAQGMAGGQVIDLEHVGKAINIDGLLAMHHKKTGALIQAAVLIGACCHIDQQSDAWAKLTRYAQHLGLAFQVIDDIIDVQTDSLTLGKTAGKDALHNKPTTVSLLGLDQAKHMADKLAEDALAALDGFDDKAWVLRALVAQVAKRRS